MPKNYYGDYSDDDSKIRWKSSVTGFDLGSKGNANLDAFQPTDPVNCVDFSEKIPHVQSDPEVINCVNFSEMSPTNHNARLARLGR